MEGWGFDLTVEQLGVGERAVVHEVRGRTVMWLEDLGADGTPVFSSTAVTFDVFEIPRREIPPALPGVQAVGKVLFAGARAWSEAQEPDRAAVVVWPGAVGLAIVGPRLP